MRRRRRLRVRGSDRRHRGRLPRAERARVVAAGGSLMHVCTVVGNVWATKKDETLQGLRLLVVQPLNADGSRTAETMVAVDPLGAGIGERVLVVHGRAARYLIG